jgi:hypothetical protein
MGIHLYAEIVSIKRIGWKVPGRHQSNPISELTWMRTFLEICPLSDAKSKHHNPTLVNRALTTQAKKYGAPFPLIPWPYCKNAAAP